MATTADRSTLQSLHRARKRRADVGAVEADLREHVRGEVRFDDGHRAALRHATPRTTARLPHRRRRVPRDADDVVGDLRVLPRTARR